MIKNLLFAACLISAVFAGLHIYGYENKEPQQMTLNFNDIQDNIYINSAGEMIVLSNNQVFDVENSTLQSQIILDIIGKNIERLELKGI